MINLIFTCNIAISVKSSWNRFEKLVDTSMVSAVQEKAETADRSKEVRIMRLVGALTCSRSTKMFTDCNHEGVL
jgi:hypothetical protein